jgi:NAD-dependent SIR2 family protein deacetylase
MAHKRNCDCDSCKNNLPFNLPVEIVESTIKGDLVIFAGAGISTENKQIFKKTLYEEIFEELPNKPNEKPDFPSLMSSYCNSTVNGKQKLLQKIKYRFDYCHQFSELYFSASQFHNELSSISYIKEIITTNWDDYFERECNAIPFVTPEDFAFYSLPDRKVYKIHGSISNYGSIVATKEDYDNCYRNLNKGIIGSYLKTILATKTIVFFGYSFRDYDFNKIYNYLKKELKGVLPHCYIVTLDPDLPKKLNHQNITLINTDGTYFLSVLRKRLEKEKYLIPRDNLDGVYVLNAIFSKLHKETTDQIFKSKQSKLMFCAFYQDGINHAFDYLFFHAKSGKSFDPVSIFNSLESYNTLRKKVSKAKNYADLAYLDGYTEGLQAIFLGKRISGFPFWYLFGKGPITNKTQFDRFIKSDKTIHSSSELYGKRYFKKSLDDESKIILSHRPFF